MSDVYRSGGQTQSGHFDAIILYAVGELVTAALFIVSLLILFGVFLCAEL